MKMSKERYEEIRDGMKNVIDKMGRDYILSMGLSGDKLYWGLFHIVWFDFQTENVHPTNRYNEYKSFNWLNDLYKEVNDDHIATALRKIGKELNIGAS